MGLEPPLQPEGRPATDAGEPVPGESPVASTPSQPTAPTSAGTTPDLPEFAKKADDLEAIKKAVEDAAAVSGALWFSYLFVMFYFAIAAGAVTHEDLFFERSVKLPFLGIDLPLLAFFFLAPILFVIVHAYTLVQLVMLTDKAKRFDQALHHQIGQKSGLPKDESDRRAVIRGLLQRQLPSNIFVQFLAGHADIREGPFGWLLRGIAWSTLVVAPVLLLILMQIQFLPFHSSFITWTHRLALLADLALIWWLWRRIQSGREVERRDPIAALNAFEIALLASVAAILLSWTIGTFPGELQEDFLAKWDRPKWTVTPHNWLFSGPIDETTRRRTSLFSSTLVLTGLNIYEGLGIDDPEKAKWHDYVFRARSRDLRGAIFDFATLPKVDLAGADLQGAQLYETQLQGASLNKAQLQGANLTGADLRGASLAEAKLEGAWLECFPFPDGRDLCVQLQGASLVDAELRGTSLNGAALEGASLIGADLQGASLWGAKLQGASFARADLRVASLENTALQGADLGYANLQGASLKSAQLQGASLWGAQLQGVSFDRAVLKATDLSYALLWRSNGERADVSKLRLSQRSDDWKPVWRDDMDLSQELRGAGEVSPWTNQAFRALQRQIESLPASGPRDAAMDLIGVLDCADRTLASCDPSLPQDDVVWRSVLAGARQDEGAFAKALAVELNALACSGDDNAIFVVRGSGFQSRLLATAAEATKLINDITNKDSKDCPVSAALTDADRAKLLQIKQEIEKAQK